MDLGRLPTPAALVDLERLERNCRLMRERAAGLGVRLRPHVKTHKCVEAARLQLGGTGPVTVSTLAEARAFAEAGFDDIVYAVPIAPQRLAAAAEVARGLRRLALLVDHPSAIDAVEADARERGRAWPVLLEVDCGGGRTGVDPEDEGVVGLAGRLAASRHLDFLGLLTHAGHAYSCRDRSEAARVARQERDVVVALADRLRLAGIEVREVSVGSTPTSLAVDHLDGASEMRPGNYAFFDAFQAAIGSCTLDQVALSVLATVISVRPSAGQLVVDAGALALSRDPGPVHVDPGCGFGVLVEEADQRVLAGLRLASLTQEHGVVEAEDPALLDGIEPGHLLRVLPNHSCLTAACFARYHAVRGTRVEDVWRPARGWR